MDSKIQEVCRVHERLVEEYGERSWRARDPVGTLVNTILSQNTNDVNRDKAYQRLRERLPTWEEVRDAPEEEVVEAIRPAGLGPTKGPRIQEALRILTEKGEEGEIELAFVKEMDVEQARDWLESIPGVGPKTASIVLLFAFGQPAFPVDTHVHRVTRRLGLIPEGTSPAKAHTLLEEIVPEEIYYSFHLNLIEHGRAVCHARNPEHERCTVREMCAFYQSSVK